MVRVSLAANRSDGMPKVDAELSLRGWLLLCDGAGAGLLMVLRTEPVAS